MSREWVFSSHARHCLYGDGNGCFVFGAGEEDLTRTTPVPHLFLQSGIAQGGGLTQTYQNSADQYTSGFSLALRMISVASGVTIGLFGSQVLGQYRWHSTCDFSSDAPPVYLFGTRKNAAHFAF